MLTHKLERLTKLMDKLFDKWVPPMSAEDEAKFQKMCNDDIKNMEETSKRLGLPPLDAKNPYRFW